MALRDRIAPATYTNGGRLAYAPQARLEANLCKLLEAGNGNLPFVVVLSAVFGLHGLNCFTQTAQNPLHAKHYTIPLSL